MNPMFSMTGFFNDICLVEILFATTWLYGSDLVRAKSGKNLSVNFIKGSENPSFVFWQRMNSYVTNNGITE